MRPVWWGLATLCSVAATGCSDAGSAPVVEPEPKGWQPGNHLPSLRDAAPRGLLDVRGLIHAHSVYSHDACDGEPWDEQTDAINEPCFEDFRRDMCLAAHDFIMLTDHDERFSRTEFPDVLLYRSERGDELVERNGEPVASWAACDPTDSPEGAYDDLLVLAGTESDTMPVGLEGHVAATEEARNAIYNDASSESVATLQAHGAVVLAQHTEDWTPEQLRDLGFDGFEMYNLHANTITGAGGVFELLSPTWEPEQLPHPDLVLMNIVNEDARYLDTWADVLADGNKRVTTMGTDCHQNTITTLMQDGERVDSYRRMMIWLSNHLLISPEADGSWDDRHLKEALRNGRLFGVFEVFGYPTGFDFVAFEDGQVREMGSEVSLQSDVMLEAKQPEVRDLDPDFADEQPTIKLRLLRAQPGGWEQLDEVDGDLSYTVTEPGAYRVEARIQPEHLRRSLNDFDHLADAEYVWIYSNPVYVVP